MPFYFEFTSPLIRMVVPDRWSHKRTIIIAPMRPIGDRETVKRLRSSLNPNDVPGIRQCRRRCLTFGGLGVLNSISTNPGERPLQNSVSCLKRQARIHADRRIGPRQTVGSL